MRFGHLAILLCATFLFQYRQIYGASEIVPLQERAQGQSLVGASQLNDSLHSNPAANAFVQVYSVDVSYFMPKSFSASVLDTKTSSINGSLGYFKENNDGSRGLEGLKLGLSGKLSEVLSLGVAGKALWGPNVAGESDKLNDVDTGLLFRMASLQAGLVVRNTLGGNDRMDFGREWSAGLRYGWQQTLFASVATVSRWKKFSPYQYGVGAEYVSPYYFSIKGGYRIQPDDSKSYWSTGVSLLSPRLSVHYAVEFPRQPDEKVEHNVGVTMMF